MRNQPLTPTHLFLLFLTSTIPRLIGALWLPNAFGDAYAYTEQIYHLRRAILNGSFSLASLFGFWLPLYQLICASISAIAGSPFYVPKLVSALSGGGVCVLVYLLTWELTFNRSVSLVTTAIAALNPYHILYSSSAMTDVPHAFFILLCAYCCIRQRLLTASLCGLAAGLIRIESWTLIPLIPTVYLLNPTTTSRIRTSARRLFTSAALFLFLCAGPIFWLIVTWDATGNVWRYFEIRNNYIVETLANNPWLAHVSFAGIALDSTRFVYTTNPAVLYVSALLFVTLLKTKAAYFVSNKSVLQCIRDFLTTPKGLLLIFFLTHLTFLLFAYCTRNQPEIWPRYGLLFFTLGLPLLAFSFIRQEYFRPRGWYIVAGVFAIQFCVQLIDVTRIVVKPDANLTVAQFLDDQRQANGATSIYCEDGAIRVLSGIPLEEFKDQYNSPVEEKAFLDSLKQNNVRFLIYKDLPGSRLKDLLAKIKAEQKQNGITLEEIAPKPRTKTGDNVVVYRIHEGEMAELAKIPPTSQHRRQ